MLLNGESMKQSEMTYSPRRHRRARSSNIHGAAPSMLPTTSSFFEDEPLKLSIVDNHNIMDEETGSELWKGHNKPASPRILPLISPHRRASLSKLGVGKPRQPLNTSTVRRIAAVISLCAAVPWAYSQSRGYDIGNNNDGAVAASTGANERTSLRRPPSFITRSTLEQDVGGRKSLRGQLPAVYSVPETVSTPDNGDNNSKTAAEIRCDDRKHWHAPSASTPTAGLRAERAQCSALLPSVVVENEGWLIAVHIDRAPTKQASSTHLRGRGVAAIGLGEAATQASSTHLRGRGVAAIEPSEAATQPSSTHLRGHGVAAIRPSEAATQPSSTHLRGRGVAAIRPSEAAPRHRDLPHQYFVRVVEGALEGIKAVEPAANVDVVVLTDGRWEGLVDDTGVPVAWDVSADMCEGLGLSCTQTTVPMENAEIVTDALECISAADVVVSSENEFSRAVVSLAGNVKILTDQWEMDADEEMVVLNPLTIMAGAEMPLSDRAEISRVIREHFECAVF